MNYSKFEYFKNIGNSNKKVIIINLLSSIVIISVQLFLIKKHNEQLLASVMMLNFFLLIIYCFFIFHIVKKFAKLEEVSLNLEQEKLCNKTLQTLYDDISAFKHDFFNIIAGIGGYIETEDIDGLRLYYRQLLQDCQHINDLCALNPDSINNPAIYSIISNKYHIADSKGIKVHIECVINFNKLCMPIYEFTRILGILLDNAIEASVKSEKKLINIFIRDDVNCKKQILIIENSYYDNNIDLNKIYEKRFTTKKGNSGLGLWEVNKIISKYKNILKLTTKSEDFFKQQIEIYYK